MIGNKALLLGGIDRHRETFLGISHESSLWSLRNIAESLFENILNGTRLQISYSDNKYTFVHGVHSATVNTSQGCLRYLRLLKTNRCTAVQLIGMPATSLVDEWEPNSLRGARAIDPRDDDNYLLISEWINEERDGILPIAELRALRCRPKSEIEKAKKVVDTSFNRFFNDLDKCSKPLRNHVASLYEYDRGTKAYIVKDSNSFVFHDSALRA